MTVRDMDKVANEVIDLLAAIDRRHPIVSASVSGVYTTGGGQGMPIWHRVAVGLNGVEALVPRFACREDAVAFRAAAGDVLDRAT